jgi:sulfur carrier protein
VITVNGEPRAVAGTVDDVLDALGIEVRRGMAVAVDAEVVPRSAWSTTQVADGARVEIVTAVQGG